MGKWDGLYAQILSCLESRSRIGKLTKKLDCPEEVVSECIREGLEN